ncbi:MAG: GntR family transcriptional regulator [Bryobacteraceae bacterium]
MELQRLKRQRATDEVYYALRHGILGHLFKSGERLLIEDIAGKLGVSLTPVRHAIQQLAAEGLVEIRPRSGTYVAQISALDVRETSEIRCALECLAAELAVARITGAHLTGFRTILEALARPVQTDEDRKRHEADNMRFHGLLIEVSGNRKLAEMYESLRAHLQIARVHGREAGWGDRLRQEHAEHEEILIALEARDAERLKRALRMHIFRAKDDLAAGLLETVNK